MSQAIMRCLEKNPADRWQSADELLAHLDLIAATPSGGMTPTNTRPVRAVKFDKRTRSKAPLLMGGGVLLAAAVAAFLVLGRSGGGGIHRIGVMPIEDISKKDSLFVTAMHDALTNALAKLGTVGVASRSEMMRYKGSTKTLREIAAEQKLDAVVEATVYQADSVMRINVQFSDPVATRSLWANTYNTSVNDKLKAQSTVVDQIQAGIGGVLAGPKKTGAVP
jgi:TolB-like protein